MKYTKAKYNTEAKNRQITNKNRQITNKCSFNLYNML